MGSSKPLFAPWRIRYILDKSEKIPGCFMCHYGKHPEEDPKNLVIGRLDHFYLVLNRYPYAAGHLMLCPYEHLGHLSALSAGALSSLGEALKKVEILLQKQMNPQGFNVGLNLGAAAGAGYAEHLHFHILPRWSGDTNFMPLLADIHVIPQALEELHAQLQERWNQEFPTKEKS